MVITCLHHGGEDHDHGVSMPVFYGADIDPDDTYGLNNNDFYAVEANQTVAVE